jgi:hypothetical protein
MLIGDPEAGSVSVCVVTFHSLLEDLLWQTPFSSSSIDVLKVYLEGRTVVHGEKVGGDEKMRVR